MMTVRNTLLSTGWLLAAACGVLLSACGGGTDNQPPTAIGQTISLQEDTSATGVVTGADPEGNAVQFLLTGQPAHGSANLDPATGAFTYTPDPDYFGQDTFQFRTSDGRRASPTASVSLHIQNVNDPPVLGPIPDLTNSPEARDVVYQLPATDADGDPLTITASSDDPSVASVSANDAGRTITISPITVGSTVLHVDVRDAASSVGQAFRFSVRDVTKTRTVAADMGAGDAITLINTSAQPVSLTLEHNGFPMFQSDMEMVDFVNQMPPEYSGEPFERKLWRFTRDNVYHSVPLNADQWLYDPWAVVNSLGWGFCGHVAAAYVRAARAAGYDARVWGLSGHVVPEIKIGDRWEIYDPDLAVYYFTQDSQIAGVSDIQADTSLITAPVQPIFGDAPNRFQYSETLADIYGTSADNFLGDDIFLAALPAQYQRLTLPGNAQLTYPGHWTPAVTGVDGTIPYEVPYYLEAMLTTPAAWSGNIEMPWMLWEIRGAGRVRLFGADYDVGSPELQALIQAPTRQIASVEVLDASSDLQFVLFINAMRYGLTSENTVRLTGTDVWSVQVGKTTLAPENRADPNGALTYKKPTP